MNPPPPPPQLDIVSAATFAAGLLFGSEVAHYVGPYAVIIIGAILGGAWSTSRRPPTTRLDALVFMLCMVGLALLVTVPLSDIAAAHLGVEARYVLGPVAALIGAVGPDWPEVVRWALGLLRNAIERRTGGTP